MDRAEGAPREVSLAEVLLGLRRNRARIVLAGLLGVLVAGGITLWQRPTYVAAARVRIVDPPTQPSIASALGNLPFGFAGLVGTSSAVTEMEVMSSRPLASSVVDPPDPDGVAPDAGLGLLDVVEDLERVRMWPIVRRKLTGAALSGSLAVEIRRWGFPEDSGTVLRLDFLGPREVEVSFDRWFAPEPMRVTLADDGSLFFAGAELRLAPDGDLTGRSFTVARRPRQETIDLFLEDLAVRETQRGSSILAVSFPDALPERSAAIVNATVRSYLAHNRQRQIEQADRSAGFLEEELGRVRAELAAAEQRLLEFGERAGDIALPETAVAVIEELIEADVERARLELGARSTEDLLARIDRGELSETSLAALEAVSLADFSPEVPLAVLLAQRSALLLEYTEEWPEVRRLGAEIEARVAGIRTLLEDEARRDRELAGDLERISARYGEKLSELPETQIELLRHQRAVETYSRIFTLLVGRIQESKIAETTAVPSAEVVEWAVPPRLRQSPGVKLNLGLGAVLGLFLGLGLALLRERVRLLSSVAQVEEAFGARLLHAIPRDRRGGSRPLVLRDRPEEPEAESYRALCSVFLHAIREAPRASAVVCGVRRDEGASRTTANLALALARAGRRVLVVDADLEAGAQAAWFGVAAEAGLGQVATGALGWEQAVVPSGQEGLDLLPAGAREAAASDRVAGQRSTSWLEEALGEYEFVLFDAAPVLERAAAAALAAEVGSVVFVCRPERVAEARAVEASARIRRAGARVLGVVLNATRRTAGVV